MGGGKDVPDKIHAYMKLVRVCTNFIWLARVVKMYAAGVWYRPPRKEAGGNLPAAVGDALMLEIIESHPIHLS
jgi:hypothetical protein